MNNIRQEQVSRPLYQQIIEDLKSRITEGEFSAGERLPGEADLGQEYGVSRITIRHALAELCDAGYLIRRQGLGTFVSKYRIRRVVSSVKSFSESCALIDCVPSYKVIRMNLVEPRPDEVQFLGLEPDDLLIYTRRILSADDVPIIQENCFYPYDDRFSWILQTPLDQPLYPLLYEHDLYPKKNVKSTLEIVTASEKMAVYMRMPKGGPMFYRTAYLVGQDDRPMFIERSYIVGSRYIFDLSDTRLAPLDTAGRD